VTGPVQSILVTRHSSPVTALACGFSRFFSQPFDELVRRRSTAKTTLLQPSLPSTRAKHSFPWSITMKYIESERRWFQVSLSTLLWLLVVIAAFFAGWRIAERRAERAIQQAREEAKAAAEASRKAQDSNIFSFYVGLMR